MLGGARMQRELFAKGAELSEKNGYTLITTAERDGSPYVTVAGPISATNSGEIQVTYRFCPETMKNLEGNKHISLVIWDRETDIGYQIQRTLSLQAKCIFAFTERPHSDKDV